MNFNVQVLAFSQLYPSQDLYLQVHNKEECERQTWEKYKLGIEIAKMVTVSRDSVVGGILLLIARGSGTKSYGAQRPQ